VFRHALEEAEVEKISSFAEDTSINFDFIINVSFSELVIEMGMIEPVSQKKEENMRNKKPK